MSTRYPLFKWNIMKYLKKHQTFSWSFLKTLPVPNSPMEQLQRRLTTDVVLTQEPGWGTGKRPSSLLEITVEIWCTSLPVWFSRVEINRTRTNSQWHMTILNSKSVSKPSNKHCLLSAAHSCTVMFQGTFAFTFPSFNLSTAKGTDPPAYCI